ncbi:MAG: hypothetical protein RR400_00690 [Clostridia bacterium]
MVQKKTVVLSGVKGGSEKAILSFCKEGHSCFGSVKLYNFRSEPAGILSLAILSLKKVLKSGLKRKDRFVYEFELDGEFDTENFTVAIINSANGNVLPILIGASGTSSSEAQDLSFANGILEISKSGFKKLEVENALNKNGIDFDDEEKREVENAIDECLKQDDSCKNSCASCKYRQAFYDGEKDAPKKEEEKETLEKSFLSDVLPQIDRIFEENPCEEFLQNIIPSSKWVRVDMDEGSLYYVIGLISEDDEIKYICYGVPGLYSSEPPKELKGFAQWLPLDENKPFEYGYWIMSQNAETGASEKVQIV